MMGDVDWRSTTLHSMFAPDKRKHRHCHNFVQVKSRKNFFSKDKKQSWTRAQERQNKILQLIGKLQ